MQKYIAVVNPKMDEDEITALIRKGIAGALFEISHQNYPVALKLIEQIKKLSRKYHKPVSIIQDVSSMEDPLDLQFGLRSGVDWIATDKHEHIKLIKGLNKLAGIIFKGHNLPKGVRVDSVMATSFVDPDAIIGKNQHVKHLLTEHKNQNELDAILHLAEHSGSSAIAVSDLELAKALSFRNSKNKIVFSPDDHSRAAKGSIYKGVYPIFMSSDLASTLKHSFLAKKGDRVMDARELKHVVIHLIP